MQLKTWHIIFLTIIGLISCFAIAIYFLSINQNQYKNPDINYGSGAEYATTIIDGDTFILNNGETIRILCVDTPEKGSVGYEEAKTYLSSIVYGKNIKIERAGLDKYNRTLAWVYSEDKSTDKVDMLINKEIIDNEFGVLFEYNNTDCSKVK